MSRTKQEVKHIVFACTVILSSGCVGNPDATLPYTVDVTSASVGRLNAQSVFDASRINALLPGFDVAKYTAFEEGVSLPVLQVSRHDVPVMTIEPDIDHEHIGQIRITHPDVTLNGEKFIGHSIDTLDHLLGPCDRRDHLIECRTQDDPNIFLTARSGSNRVDSILWKADHATH